MEYYGTLGPSCQDPETLKKMLAAGMTGLRLNLSHGSLPGQASLLAAWHKAQEEAGVQGELLIDLEGPELRTGVIPRPFPLIEGSNVLLGPGGIPVPDFLPSLLSPDQELLLDDGKLLLKVTQTGDSSVSCLVIRGGILRSRKSLALKNPAACEIHLPALTENDRKNLAAASKFGVTGVMLPFVRGQADLLELKRALADAGASGVRIFAKLENQEGLQHLKELFSDSDMIVIARGDLGNCLPLWELPRAQKETSACCQKSGVPFLVVTQMLDSMQNRPVPTRAEVLDIFNAVLDGASALMLTGETAVGRYPAEAMEYLVRTAEEALRYQRD
ncbi:pyruvate kinase [Cuneatibacter sp. NSJ-177]|uniref:pyruvate kinase n=1 Tax=Cuneatibacter sp. NSJ-177 TaxID=2931401 RepID=UPI001FD53E75|nr:pyruvate kinase [Cuneatibacter sp. NSJ-177]MCJ7834262.1 pyruvate kinase [Cuneatibacter sp. NSJ-177]